MPSLESSGEEDAMFKATKRPAKEWYRCDVTDCPNAAAALEMCLETYEDVREEEREFGPSILSRFTIFYTNGSVARVDPAKESPPQLPSQPYSHEELDEAYDFAELLEKKIKPLQYPESEEEAILTAFVLTPVLQEGESRISDLNEQTIAQAFNGTIHSAATVFVVKGAVMP